MLSMPPSTHQTSNKSWKHQNVDKHSSKFTISSEWAEEKARKVAREKGWDYQALKQEWLAFADNPDDAGAAFLGFCNKKETLR